MNALIALLLCHSTMLASDFTPGGLFVFDSEYKYSLDTVEWVYDQVADDVSRSSGTNKNDLISLKSKLMIKFSIKDVSCGKAIGCYWPYIDIIEVSTVKKDHSGWRNFDEIYCILAHETTHFLLSELGFNKANLLHSSPFFFKDGDYFKVETCKRLRQT